MTRCCGLTGVDSNQSIASSKKERIIRAHSFATYPQQGSCEGNADATSNTQMIASGDRTDDDDVPVILYI